MDLFGLHLLSLRLYSSHFVLLLFDTQECWGENIYIYIFLYSAVFMQLFYFFFPSSIPCLIIHISVTAYKGTHWNMILKHLNEQRIMSIAITECEMLNLWGWCSRLWHNVHTKLNKKPRIHYLVI